MDSASILARQALRWDLDADLPVPRPGWMRCPVCASGDLLIREWRIGPRVPAERHQLSHRVDVSLKCLDCSAVWWHGLAVDSAIARRFGWGGVAVRVVEWRDAGPAAFLGRSLWPVPGAG
jgi:hypothetical protein